MKNLIFSLILSYIICIEFKMDLPPFEMRCLAEMLKEDTLGNTIYILS